MQFPIDMIHEKKSQTEAFLGPVVEIFLIEVLQIIFSDKVSHQKKLRCWKQVGRQSKQTYLENGIHPKDKHGDRISTSNENSKEISPSSIVLLWVRKRDKFNL